MGHGSRSILATAEFFSVLRRVRVQLTGAEVRGGFLELARPSLADAMRDLANRGVREVAVAPLFLFAAGHAKRDVPEQTARLARELGLGLVGQSRPLEAHPAIVAISLARYFSASQAVPQAEGEPSALLLAGRGSQDETAIQATLDFAQQCRSRLAPSTRLRTGFLSMARPSLSQAIDELCGDGARDVTVVPHLIFHGDLLEKCGALLREAADRHPQVVFRLAGRLGPDPGVAEALLARISEAGFLHF